jgi:hypothetical protein
MVPKAERLMSSVLLYWCAHVCMTQSHVDRPCCADASYMHSYMFRLANLTSADTPLFLAG